MARSPPERSKIALTSGLAYSCRSCSARRRGLRSGVSGADKRLSPHTGRRGILSSTDKSCLASMSCCGFSALEQATIPTASPGDSVGRTGYFMTLLLNNNIAIPSEVATAVKTASSRRSIFCCCKCNSTWEMVIQRKAQAKPELSKGIDQSRMASPRGVEPPAYRLGGGCSIQLSYGDTAHGAVGRRRGFIIPVCCGKIKRRVTESA